MDMSLSKLGIGDGERSLACWSQWSQKELDTTEQQNWRVQILVVQGSTVILLLVFNSIALWSKNIPQRLHTISWTMLMYHFKISYIITCFLFQSTYGKKFITMIENKKISPGNQQPPSCRGPDRGFERDLLGPAKKKKKFHQYINVHWRDLSLEI